MQNGKELIRIKVLLEGRVQGVSLRYYLQKKATELNLTGFVRNLTDGRVEAVFEGNKNNTDSILKWCETGSPYSRIDSIALRYEEPAGKFVSFDVRY